MADSKTASPAPGTFPYFKPFGKRKRSPFLQKGLPLRITPYYASLMDSKPRSGFKKKHGSVSRELRVTSGEAADPGEEGHSPVPVWCTAIPTGFYLATEFCSALPLLPVQGWWETILPALRKAMGKRPLYIKAIRNPGCDLSGRP